MKITLNGNTLETSANSLADLIIELEYGDAKIAAALDGKFVPAALYAETVITDGCDVEIVAPMQGG